MGLEERRAVSSALEEGAAPSGELGCVCVCVCARARACVCVCLDLGLSSAAGQLLVLEPLRAGVASWERRENGGGGGGWAGGHGGANSRLLRLREF